MQQMLPQSDHPTPPAALTHILELTKACYPESADRIDKYMEFVTLFCVFVSTRGLIAIDHALRVAFFDSATPFFFQSCRPSC